jgi:hypothetical protein
MKLLEAFPKATQLAFPRYTIEEIHANEVAIEFGVMVNAQELLCRIHTQNHRDNDSPLSANDVN